MNAAERVIVKFGGPAALARMLGKGQTTVSYWKKAGSIPTKWQPILVNLAQEKGIALDFDDFAADTPGKAEQILPKGALRFALRGGLLLLLLALLGFGGFYTFKFVQTSSNSPGQTGQIAANPAQTAAENVKTGQSTPQNTAEAARDGWFTAATHGEWKIRCHSDAQPETMASKCVGILDVMDANHKLHAVVWAVGRNTHGGFVSNIQIPSGVMIGQGLTLKLTAGGTGLVNTAHFDFSSCEPAGCLVKTIMDGTFLIAARDAAKADITAYSSTGHAITFHLPVVGMGQVLADLK